MTPETRQHVRECFRYAAEDAARQARRTAAAANPFVEAVFSGEAGRAAQVRSFSTRLGQTVVPAAVAAMLTARAGEHGYDLTLQASIPAPTGPAREATEAILRDLQARRRAPDFAAEVARIREAAAQGAAEDGAAEDAAAGDSEEAAPEEPAPETAAVDAVVVDGAHRYVIQLASPKLSPRAARAAKQAALWAREADPETTFVLGLYYDGAAGPARLGRPEGPLARYFEAPRYQPVRPMLTGTGLLRLGLPGAVVLRGAAFWTWIGDSDSTYDELIEIAREVGAELG